MSALDLISRVERKLVKIVPKHKQFIKGNEAVVSFSFDDFPVSAFNNAGAVLEKYGMNATYYVASNLMGTTSDGMAICTQENVRDTFDSGHEIGCHTFAHLDCQSVLAGALEDDLKASSQAIKGLTGIIPSSFAFPFGKISFASRNIVSKHFRVARGISGGVNYGNCDLLNLRANSIYSASFLMSKNRALLQEAQRKKGWLIFYTHDVTSNPGNFGCTLDEFTQVVELVAQSGVKVLPVKHAMGYFAFQ
ncbi:MAG: polysaccharide deacetylase family protein [Rhizobiaceae bacterium]